MSPKKEPIPPTTNARKGFNLALRSEVNIRVHVAIATFILFFALVLKFSALEYCILIFVIALVIVTEMLNTAIEFALDSLYHNKYSRIVGMAKIYLQVPFYLQL